MVGSPEGSGAVPPVGDCNALRSLKVCAKIRAGTVPPYTGAPGGVLELVRLVVTHPDRDAHACGCSR